MSKIKLKSEPTISVINSALNTRLKKLQAQIALKKEWLVACIFQKGLEYYEKAILEDNNNQNKEE